jgi:hypothetical protein
LFSSGELGVISDPNAAGRAFQTAAGTSVVNADGQPVGFSVDLSQGAVLGSNIATNGDFSAGSTGWTVSGANVAITGGQAVWTVAAANERIVQTGINSALAYQLDFDVSSYTSGSVYPIGTGVDVPASATGTFSWLMMSTTQIYIRSGGGGFTGAVDNVVCRQLFGNHIRQSTAANRPTFRVGPNRFEFDGTDIHPVIFPSSLGSDCTVARAIPGGGAEILTGQTIGTSYNITQTHAGFVIVNRALTSGETAGLTAWLEARASGSL